MKKTFFVVCLSLYAISSYAQEQSNNIVNNPTVSIEQSSLDDDDSFYFKDKFQAPIYDPLESVNRKVYSFNKGLDQTIIKPTTEAYKEITPSFIQTGIRNVFNYIKSPFNLINYTLQGNGQKAGDSMARFLLNTLGLGVLDFASEAEIPLENTSLGETLGVWGVGEGPYVVLPVIGGATLRDNGSAIIEITTSPENNLSNTDKAFAIGIKIIDKRSQLLQLDKTIEEGALDEYLFVRNAQVQQKRSTINELKSSN